MSHVDVQLPSADEYQKTAEEFLKPILDAAEKTAAQFGTIIKEYAILQNQDVDGNQMAAKKPRPPKAPHNFPGLPLIQNDDPDLMANTRFTVERDESSVSAVYTPPGHLEYLLTKMPEHGGRRFISYDRINPNAMRDIIQLLLENLGTE